MSIKAFVYIATSLDGFIASNDGGLDWLNEANATVPDGEDCGFHAFMDSVDALFIGRKTYEQVLSLGEWALWRDTCCCTESQLAFFLRQA